MYKTSVKLREFGKNNFVKPQQENLAGITGRRIDNNLHIVYLPAEKSAGRSCLRLAYCNKLWRSS